MVSSSTSAAPSDSTNLRRRRRSGSEEEKSKQHDNDKDDEARQGSAKAAVEMTRNLDSKKPPPPAWNALLVFLHLVALGIFIWGWILRQQLHTSVECDMTYSQRQLIPIPLSPKHAKYGLYKFLDQRDPRPHHRAMMQRWLKTTRVTGEDDYRYNATTKYLNDNQPFLEDGQHHCTPPSLYQTIDNGTVDTTVAVLYIPGHWGSYMQSRSIGAHGIQLTGARNMPQQQRVLQALSTNQWQGLGATEDSEFVFDVYAIDFQEEGAALHAQFLWEQTAFVAHAIRHLVDSCHLSQVVLLGHSIGGYVSRLVPILYPDTQPFIANIITLGSPHAHPVFGWESSIHHLHETYLASSVSDNHTIDNNHHTLVAISGGIRDEMIPPVAGQAPSSPVVYSVLAPDIMQPGTSTSTTSAQPQLLGMDHRAIVWCHNLLSVVRGVIYTVIQTGDKTPQGRVESVKEYLGLTASSDDGYSYDKSLELHQARFRQLSGLGPSIAMESAMLYHLEVLVGLFVILGCFQCAGWGCLFLGSENPTIQWRMQVLPLLITICLASRTNYELHWLSLVVLTLVANAVLWILRWILGVGMCYLHSSPDPLSKRMAKIRVFSMGVFLLLVGLHCVGKLFIWKTRFCLALLFTVCIATLSSTIVLASSSLQKKASSDILRDDARLVAFTSTFFLTCPCLVAGKIMALSATSTTGTLLADIPTEYTPDSGLSKLTIKLLLPIVLRLLWLHLVQPRPDDDDEKPSPPPPDKELRASSPPSFLDFLRAVLMTLAILYTGPSLFQMGQGYRAGDLLIAICWLECFMHSLYVKLMD